MKTRSETRQLLNTLVNNFINDNEIMAKDTGETESFFDDTHVIRTFSMWLDDLTAEGGEYERKTNA